MLRKKYSCINLFLNDKRKWCILKLSPTCNFTSIDKYYKMGFRQFHCSNTIPVKEGGLSGKSLIPYNKKLIKHIDENYKDTTIIAGGGITDIDDIIMYKDLGAKHFAFSSVMFHFFHFSILIFHTITFHTIPYHSIPYHSIPFHTIPFHSIPYFTVFS